MVRELRYRDSTRSNLLSCISQPTDFRAVYGSFNKFMLFRSIILHKNEEIGLEKKYENVEKDRIN